MFNQVFLDDFKREIKDVVSEAIDDKLQEDRVYNKNELMRLFQIGQSTLLEMHKKGLKCMKAGRQILYVHSDVIQFIKDNSK